jgi:hypothetical protein
MAGLEKRLDVLQAQAAPRQARPEIPEWMHWLTYAELDELETIIRIADVANAAELDERSCHRVWTLYSAAKVRILDAPLEVRAAPAARDAYLREVECRDGPWCGPPLYPDVGR